jgi:Protein of unknown function (DUF3175)
VVIAVATPYQSAIAMPTLCIKRAGGDLPEQRNRILELAKSELRKAFVRE